jgi:hypothetical protein
MAVGALYVAAPSDGRCVGLRPNAEAVYTGLLLKNPPVKLEVNDLGYRGPVLAKERRDGVNRIAFVGDSITYGQGVRWNETLPHYVGSELEGRGFVETEVMNFGIPGLGASDFRDHYARYVRLWNPETVVLVVVSNDLYESICDVVPDSVVEWTLFRLSYVYRLGKIVDAMGSALGRTFFLDEGDGARDSSRLGGYLAELESVVRQHGGTLAVVTLEDPISHKGGASAELLTGVMNESGLSWLDLRQNDFERIRGDGHLSPAGNHEAAVRTADWMIAEGLIPNER